LLVNLYLSCHAYNTARIALNNSQSINHVRFVVTYPLQIPDMHVDDVGIPFSDIT